MLGARNSKSDREEPRSAAELSVTLRSWWLGFCCVLHTLLFVRLTYRSP
ncbi:rCG34584 [Rattus norvegicus]|uniref:RCG34584 n=1 Tax=Rattus norvegicus TaxID=10116 RepID=A6HGS4_RAT|nr:rCG34584 [Rattus norvegicus]